MKNYNLQQVKYLCCTALIGGGMVGFVIAMVLWSFGLWWFAG